MINVKNVFTWYTLLAKYEPQWRHISDRTRSATVRQAT